jgi:hypothetical protein
LTAALGMRRRVVPVSAMAVPMLPVVVVAEPTL